jgi:hypothetical protein
MQLGDISCQFLLLGASIGPRYVLQLLLVKNHKVANNSATTKAREKISTYLESVEFYKFFDACLTKFKSNLILLNKITQISSYIQAIEWVKEPHCNILVVL